MLRVAIVGGGIAGLAAARQLARAANVAVTLIEAREQLGGHVRTVHTTDEDGQAIALDCGFIVFNRSRYPGFTRMLDELGIASNKSEMSFGVSAVNDSFAYSTRTPRTLFASRGSLFDAQHRQMVADIFSFLSRARRDLRAGRARDLRLDEYLESIGVRAALRDRFVYPLAGALWSSGKLESAGFPAEVFLAFLSVHGMLRPAFAPRWRTVRGGSSTYVNALRASLPIEWRLGTPVVSIDRGRDQCSVRLATGDIIACDRIVLAVHADRALELLAEPSAEEKEHLAAIRYTPNEVVVHSDERALPSVHAARAAWNYRLSGNGKVEVTYWCNKLQRLKTRTNYMVTLNPTHAIDPARIVHQTRLDHPCFDLACLRGRRLLSRLQGRHATYYAGAYFGFGFHEDGFRSGVAAASTLLSDAAAKLTHARVHAA